MPTPDAQTLARSIEGVSLVVDRATHSLRLERMLDASPQEAFDAWTQPDQVTCWWDPAGEPLTRCEIDLRVGGDFVFVSKGHAEMPFAGRYVEIVPGVRLAFEAMGAAGRVGFAAVGEQTKLSVEIQCRSDEHLDQFLQMRVDEGTARTIANLAAFVAAFRAG
ncbi:MAG TPA: SRPBCC domain-containing protein [Caulobacteraceae bacterium]|jgi:uncharacterized protein YndB with AHSA1/START domain|nr:SRPBCC domain-containing protein [Caulobacteraceae bacterium]